jgi:hypothetical protein
MQAWVARRRPQDADHTDWAAVDAFAAWFAAALQTSEVPS